jgi:hypothetical protein
MLALLLARNYRRPSALRSSPWRLLQRVMISDEPALPCSADAVDEWAET